ncbi:MAG TPA: MarR family winged helix-turn-helix transcriptional regulator [Lautropia sp.]|nr:MarR family winged helix-turn-helix transcriptional regulator [Lautropia sp.]
MTNPRSRTKETTSNQEGRDSAAPGARVPVVPSGCSNMKLRRLTRLVSRHYDAYLARCGLKTTQYSLLAVVADGGPLQQGELARLLSLDASTLTRNLRPLLEAGLLAVEAGSDARSRQVSITAAGREIRAQARQHWKRAQLDFNGAIGTERAAALHDLVDTCYRMLVSHDDRRTK